MEVGEVREVDGVGRGDERGGVRRGGEGERERVQSRGEERDELRERLCVVDFGRLESGMREL